MEVQTIQRYIHTSPRKLRLVADMVRTMEPLKALDVLNLTPKAAAKDLEKAIKTVLSNAKSQGLETQKLSFAKIEINESTRMRRFRAGTRGRVRPYKKRMSHIKIVISDEGKVISQKDSERLRKPENQKIRKSDNPEVRQSDLSGSLHEASNPSFSEKKKEAK